MGKGSLFFAKARGKIGEIVLSNVNGQEVQRAYNGSPANPRTANQMYQRGLFADVVKFFTRGQQNFFKFAFEGKKKTESDYNAFVRTNMKYGAWLTKYVMDDPTCPKVGNFIMTQGTIPAMTYDFYARNNLIGVSVYCNVEHPQITTVGQLSAALKTWNAAVTEGDIITLVTISSNYRFNYYTSMERNYMEQIKGSVAEPRWNLRQFIVNESDTTLLSEIGLYCLVQNYDLRLCDTYEVESLSSMSICGSALCVSRNAPGGLKVMTSQLVTSFGAEALLFHFGVQEDRLSQAYRNVYLASWGASEEVILQGSLARKVAPAEVIELTKMSSSFSDDLNIAISLPAEADVPTETESISRGEKVWFKFEGSGCYSMAPSDFDSDAEIEIIDIVPISDSVLMIQILAVSSSDEPATLTWHGGAIGFIPIES